jgi:hypothetical protein
MTGRPFARFALIAAAATALVAGCAKHMDNEAQATPPAPPPASETPTLAGGPQTQVMAQATSAQASEDSYLSSLPPGLMVTHRTDASGAPILVISNYPVANPAARPHLWASVRHRHHARLQGGPVVVTASAAPAVTRPEIPPVQSTAPAVPNTTVAQAPVAQAPAARAPVAPAAAPATQTAGVHGVTLSPGMWLIAGLVLLAVVVLIMLAGRKSRRHDGRGQAHA